MDDAYSEINSKGVSIGEVMVGSTSLGGPLVLSREIGLAGEVSESD